MGRGLYDSQSPDYYPAHLDPRSRGLTGFLPAATVGDSSWSMRGAGGAMSGMESSLYGDAASAAAVTGDDQGEGVGEGVARVGV